MVDYKKSAHPEHPKQRKASAVKGGIWLDWKSDGDGDCPAFRLVKLSKQERSVYLLPVNHPPFLADGRAPGGGQVEGDVAAARPAGGHPGGAGLHPAPRPSRRLPVPVTGPGPPRPGGQWGTERGGGGGGGCGPGSWVRVWPQLWVQPRLHLLLTRYLGGFMRAR